MKNIKVVLTQNIDDLGGTGEAKEVALGYARNFLLPRNLAFLTNDPRAKVLLEKAKKEKENKLSLLDEARERAQEVNGKIIKIKAKANKEGKLYAAYTAKNLADELGLKIPFEVESIKTIGEHGVVLDFGQGITSQIKLIIESTNKT